MRLCITVSSCIVILSLSTAFAFGESVKIYILAGQSNMEGHASNKHLNAIDPALLIARDDVWAVYAGRKSDFLQPGYGGNSDLFGPELKFGHMIGDHAKQKILIFKSCIGGTTLYNDWLPPSAASIAGRKTGYLYETMVIRFWNLINNLDEVYPGHAANEYEIAGMLWLQGENDSCEYEFAKDYKENLVHFINDVRNDFDEPYMPFIIAEINDSGCWVHQDLIRKAQRYADDNIPNTSLIRTSDLSPNYHYDSESIVTIGERFADAALDYYEDGEEALLSFEWNFRNSGVFGGSCAVTGSPIFVGAPLAPVGTGALKLESNDSVLLPGYKGVTGIKDRTCALWIKTTNPGPILSWGKSGPGEKWEIGVHSTGVLYLDVGNGEALGSINVMNGEWRHIAFVSSTKEVFEYGKLVRKQLTDDVKVFVDLALDKKTTFISQEIHTAKSVELSIGPGFIGMVDEVTIFDSAPGPDGRSETVKPSLPSNKVKVLVELADNLIGYWRFDEGAGIEAKDGSNSGFHGKLKGGATWQDGLYGKAVHLKANQSVQIDGFMEPLGPSGNIEGLSVSLWLQTPLWFLEDILNKGDGDNKGWAFKQYIDWAEFYAAFDKGGIAQKMFARNDWGDIAFPFGDGYEWQHVVFIYDGIKKEIRIFVDNIECGASPVSCTGLNHIIPSQKSLILGGNNWGGAYGAVDELAIWSRPLTQTEVDLLYNDGQSAALDPLGDICFSASSYFISAACGGKIELSLNGDRPNSLRTYLICGGSSGFIPGSPLPGGQAVLPLNWDSFSNFVITSLNTPLFSGFFGNLDSEGCAEAVLDTFGPVDPRVIGLKMHYAGVLFNPYDTTSNPVYIEITP